MFIGNDGEFFSGNLTKEREKKSDRSWSLTLWPKSKNHAENVCGLCCMLPRAGQIAATLNEGRDCVRNKILAVGHNAEPAVLKNGPKEEIQVFKNAIVSYVCCNFTLTAAPTPSK